MDRKDIAIAILFAAVALLLAKVFYTGPYLNFDDQLYIGFARAIAQGKFNPTLSTYSYGWLFPYFVLIAGSMGTLLEYLILILLTYFLGFRVTEDKRVGYIAAFITMLMPFTIQYATRILPDMLLGVVSTLSLVLLFSEKKREWYLSGLLAGLTLTIKPEALAFIFPYLLCLMFSKKRNILFGSLLIGIAVFFMPFLIISHNPLTFLQYGYFQNIVSHTTLLINTRVLLGSFDLIQPSNTLLGMQVYPIGASLWFAIAGLALAIKKKNIKVVVLCAIFWIFFLYLLFGSITVSYYSLANFISRYFITVVACLSIPIAYFFMELYKTIEVHSKRYAIIAVTILILILLISMIPSYISVYKYNYYIRNQLI